MRAATRRRAMVLVLACTASSVVAEKPSNRSQTRVKGVWTWHDRAFDFSAVRVIAAAPRAADERRRIARGIKTREDEIRESVIAAFEKRGYVTDPASATENETAVGTRLELHYAFTPPARPSSPRPPILRGAQSSATAGATAEISRDTSNQLYVELRNPDTGQPVWRGRVSRVLRKRAEPLERIRAAADSIAGAFPPDSHEP